MNKEDIKTSRDLLEYINNDVKEDAKEIVDKFIKASNKSNIELNEYFVKIIYMEFYHLNKIKFSQYKDKTNDPKKIQSLLTEFDYMHSLKSDSLNYTHMESNVRSLYSKIVKYKNNLKNNQKINSRTGFRYDILEQTSFEGLGDMFASLNNFDTNVRYAKSLIKSYKHLFEYELLLKDEDYKYSSDEIFRINIFTNTLELFGTIREKEFKRDEVQKSLSKIASFRKPEDLNNALTQIINSDLLNAEKVVKLIENQNLNAEVVYNDNNKIAIKINDFEASKALGSSEWCISYNDYYYNDYLTRIEDSETFIKLSNIYEELILETNTIEEGCHIFYYDFDNPENNPLSKVAFTIGANSDLTAAFDKNDQSIINDFENIVDDSIYNEIVKKSLPFNRERINITEYCPSWGYDGEFMTSLYLEQRNPIVQLDFLVNKLLENNDYVEIRLSSYEIEKIYEDHFKYHDLTDIEFIEKLFTVRNYLNKYHDYMITDYPEDFTEDRYNNSIINQSQFLDIYNKLNDLEKSVLFRKYENVFEDLLESKKEKFINYKMNEEFEYENRNFITQKHILEYANLNFNPEKKIANPLLNKSQDLFNNIIVKSLVFSDIKASDNVNEYFLNLIKDKKININIIFENNHYLSPDILKKAIDIINENPKDHFNWNIRSKTFHSLSKSDLILETLSKESLKSLSKNIELSDFEIRKDTEYTPDTALEYPNRMKKLYDMGILNDEIVESKLGMFSGMAISEQDILRKETGMNLQSYITSSSKGKSIKYKMK